MPRPARSNPCCRRCRNQILLRRAGSLREAAAREDEPILLRAAVWLEGRARRTGDPALCLEAGLHYLVLAEHPDVLAQTGLAQHYLAKADEWLQRVSGGALEGQREPVAGRIPLS